MGKLEEVTKYGEKLIFCRTFETSPKPRQLLKFSCQQIYRDYFHAGILNNLIKNDV